MIAKRKFGARFATSKAFAAPTLTPTAAMSIQVRTTPSTRETAVPAAIVDACRPRPADPVTNASVTGVAAGLLRTCLVLRLAGHRLLVSLLNERHFLGHAGGILGLGPRLGDAEPCLPSTASGRPEDSDHDADGEQHGDHRGREVLPIGSYPDGEAITCHQERTGGREHHDVHC